VYIYKSSDSDNVMHTGDGSDRNYPTDNKQRQEPSYALVPGAILQSMILSQILKIPY